MQTNTQNATTVEDQLAAYEHERLAAYASHTLEDLLNVARGYNLSRVSDLRKADLLAAIVNHEVQGEAKRVNAANDDAVAQAAGFDDRYQQMRFEAEVRALTKAAQADPTADLLAKLTEAEPHNRASVLEYAVRWGADVDACIQKGFAIQLLGFVDGATHPRTEDDGTEKPARFTNPAEALADAKQVILATPLLENYWRGGSTNAYSNAVEGDRVAVASKMLRSYYY